MWTRCCRSLVGLSKLRNGQPGQWNTPLDDGKPFFASAWMILAPLNQDWTISPPPCTVTATARACLTGAFEDCQSSGCLNQLHMPADEGKQLLTSVLYGGSVPARLQGNDFMAKVQKVSVYLRWLAVSLLTAEFDEFCGDNSGKKNPESSALSH